MDRNSYLRVSSVTTEPTGLRIGYSLGPLSTPVLQRTPTPSGPWNNLLTNPPGTNSFLDSLESIGTNQSLYYRINPTRP